MAERAVLREAGGNVGRIVSAREIRRVAGIARPRCQFVVVVHMALRALQRGVRPGEWEAGVRVIECRAGPVSRRVAERAVLLETGGNVRRVGGSREVRRVAGIAGPGSQTVVVADVALRA